MTLAAWIWASVLGTAALTIVMSGSQQLGWTRMSFPLMLGTAFTPDHDRAVLYGTGVHSIVGFVAGAVYGAFFDWLGVADWWIGTLAGAVHGALVLLVLFPVLPAVHPRMAIETQGPEPTRGLEPPGPLGSYYGRPTAVATFVAHVLFGIIVALVYGRDLANGA